MIESVYRQARGEINRLPCVFEQALLAQQAVCALSVRHLLGERETVACAQPLVRADCARLMALLREKSAFALRLVDSSRVLPHRMVMKIQCGGLSGVRSVLDPDAVAADIPRLLYLARQQHGDLEALPFSRIIQGVAAWTRQHGARG